MRITRSVDYPYIYAHRWWDIEIWAMIKKSLVTDWYSVEIIADWLWWEIEIVAEKKITIDDIDYKSKKLKNWCFYIWAKSPSETYALQQLLMETWHFKSVLYDPRWEDDEKWENVLFAIPTEVYMGFLERRWHLI